MTQALGVPPENAVGAQVGLPRGQQFQRHGQHGRVAGEVAGR
ncbi:hypothetical protein [Lentzea sp. NEAU-D7]|nr:hypothetical protein [Lentzea sp. NEAU-D7]MCX2954433.1 hypothetical protein [Lentzea sp. NEAU-D7]